MKNNDDKLNLTTGQRLKAARAYAGISQKPIVKALNTSVQSVSKWENDRVEKISSQVLRVYAELTGVTVDYLQGLVDDPKDTLFEKSEKKYQDDIDLFMAFVERFTDYIITRQGAVFDISKNKKGSPYAPVLFMDMERIKRSIVNSANAIIDLALSFALQQEESRFMHNEEIDPMWRNEDIAFIPTSQTAFDLAFPADELPEEIKTKIEEFRKQQANRKETHL